MLERSNAWVVDSGSGSTEIGVVAVVMIVEMAIRGDKTVTLMKEKGP